MRINNNFSFFFRYLPRNSGEEGSPRTYEQKPNRFYKANRKNTMPPANILWGKARKLQDFATYSAKNEIHRPTQLRRHAAHMGDWLLLQEEFCGPHAPIGVKPALHNVVAKEVGQREEAHSLVVNHPGSNDLTTSPEEAVAGVSVIGCLIESVRAEPPERIHPAQI